MTSLTPPNYTPDEERNEKSKASTHEGLETYKSHFFETLNNCTWLMKGFVWSIYLLKITFSLLILLLLISYVLPVSTQLPFDRKELQDFLLKIIAGGFFNQIITNTFGNKDK
jgi:hypothetical protein